MIETKKGANDSWKHRGNIKGGTTVVFKDSGIAGKQKTFAQLEKVMSQLGFIRWTWDYDFVIYDMRFDDLNNNKTYYLRVRANCVQGRLESPHAVLKLEDPMMGRHILHHGMDYEAEIPQRFLQTAEQVIQTLKEQLEVA